MALVLNETKLDASSIASASGEDAVDAGERNWLTANSLLLPRAQSPLVQRHHVDLSRRVGTGADQIEHLTDELHARQPLNRRPKPDGYKRSEPA